MSLIRVVLLLTLVATASSAATLNVSPSSLAHDDPNPVTLAVSGLAQQQTVLVERYHDANANGQLDAGELLILSFRVTDGRVEMFGGERDEAIPGDEDGATNGQLTVELRLSALPEANRAVGNYVFRVSPLDASFPPLVQPFTVAQLIQGQSVRGTVTGNSSPLAGAMIAALSAGGEGEDFAGGVFTDSAGTFVLNLPVGDYMVVALKPGFLSPLSSMPQVSLGSGSTITQDIALATASRTISGRVIDAVTSNGVGGLQLFAESGDEEITVIHTDASGDFTLGASVGQWLIEPSEQGLALLGFSGNDQSVDTTAGDVTGLQIPLSKGRGNFELVFFFPGGSFGNGTDGSITFPAPLNYYYALFNLDDVNFPTNVLFSGPAGSGLANTPSANFGANFEGDSAFYSSPSINVPPYPPGGLYTVNYKNEPLEFVLPDPQSQNRQVLLVPRVTLDGEERIEEIQWERRDVNGSPLGAAPFMQDIQIRIDGMGGRMYQADVSPDTTSHVPFDPVPWTNVSSIQMVYDDDAGNQYVSFWHRGMQALEILTGSNLPPAAVNSPHQILFVAAGGQPPYTWSLQAGDLPAGLNLGGTGELSGTPSQVGFYNFSVRVTDSNQQFLEQPFTLEVRAAGGLVRVEPKMRNPGQFELRVLGQTGQTYTIQYSTDLRNWFSLITTNAPSNAFDVMDSTASDAARFYRVRQP